MARDGIERAFCGKNHCLKQDFGVHCSDSVGLYNSAISVICHFDTEVYYEGGF